MTKMHARKHTHTHSKDPYDTQPDDVLQTSLQYKVQVRAMRHEESQNLPKGVQYAKGAKLKFRIVFRAMPVARGQWSR